MWQSVAWLFYELRDTAELLWYNGSVILLIALFVLASATWFSLRRS
jgi:hypothetical protein